MAYVSPISVDLTLSQFTFLRRSNPTAAFAEIYQHIQKSIENDEKFARAFSYFQDNFKGVGLEKEFAKRMKRCKKDGGGKLSIKVGNLPLEIAPGLTLMYDSALEQLKSGDLHIEPEMLDSRVVRALALNLESILPIIGATSVTALEQALVDTDYANKLKGRADDLSVAFIDDFPVLPGNCEFCEISIKDSDGKIVDRYCGSKDECADISLLFLVVVAVSFLGWLGDWLDWW